MSSRKGGASDAPPHVLVRAASPARLFRCSSARRPYDCPSCRAGGVVRRTHHLSWVARAVGGLPDYFDVLATGSSPARPFRCFGHRLLARATISMFWSRATHPRDYFDVLAMDSSRARLFRCFGHAQLARATISMFWPRGAHPPALHRFECYFSEPFLNITLIKS